MPALLCGARVRKALDILGFEIGKLVDGLLMLVSSRSVYVKSRVQNVEVEKGIAIHPLLRLCPFFATNINVINTTAHGFYRTHAIDMLSHT
jgi:hypothetical protein